MFEKAHPELVKAAKTRAYECWKAPFDGPRVVARAIQPKQAHEYAISWPLLRPGASYKDFPYQLRYVEVSPTGAIQLGTFAEKMK